MEFLGLRWKYLENIRGPWFGLPQNAEQITTQRTWLSIRAEPNKTMEMHGNCEYVRAQISKFQTSNWLITHENRYGSKCRQWNQQIISKHMPFSCLFERLNDTQTKHLFAANFLSSRGFFRGLLKNTERTSSVNRWFSSRCSPVTVWCIAVAFCLWCFCFASNFMWEANRKSIDCTKTPADTIGNNISISSATIPFTAEESVRNSGTLCSARGDNQKPLFGTTQMLLLLLLFGVFVNWLGVNSWTNATKQCELQQFISI